MGKFKTLRRVLRAWAAKLSSLNATIANNKLIIQFLDTMEEYRDLTLEEWNFRDVVQRHLSSLLEIQEIYWKQRGDIKWVKFGDASTKFFHARATIQHRRNSITCLQMNQGRYTMIII